MKRKYIFFAIIIVSNLLYAQTRVTGGYPINITDAPWQVLLLRNGELCCGGSIIAPDFILTAKHCVQNFSANSIKIIAGVTCKSEVNSSNTFEISQIILHPDPNIDAALLQSSNNITYNSNRQPVNYWASADNTLYNVGNSTRVSGWGWTIPNNSNSMPDCLEAVNLNIISNQDASNMLRPTWGRDLYVHEMAVIGTGNIRQGACHCDSGGPLTILTTTNEPVLIGVVQGGVPGCGGNNQNSPSVFVRVSYIKDWIETVTCITNLTNQTVTTNTTVTSPCGNVNINNTTVTPTGTLNVQAPNAVNIGPNFTVQSGGSLNITTP